MRKTIFLFALATAVAFTACNGGNQEKDTNSSEQKAGTVTIEHALGKTEVPVNPERVIVLDFSALENLDAIGVKPVGIPKTGLPKYFAKYKDDESVVDLGTLVEANIEKVNELQPQLIIIGGRLRESYDQLSKIAPTIITEWDTADQFGALQKNLDNLGLIFDKKEDFDAAFNALKTKADAVKEKSSKSDAKALVVLHNKGRFSAYGSGSRFGLIHDILGVQEAAKGLDTHLHGTKTSSEFIAETNPDILFVVDRSAAIGDTPLNKEEIENKLIQRTNAFKNGKIIYLNSETWYLSGSGLNSLNMMIDEVDNVL